MSLIQISEGQYINPDHIERVAASRYDPMYVKIYWRDGGSNEIKREQFDLLLSQTNRPEPAQLTKDERDVVNRAIKLLMEMLHIEDDEQSELADTIRSIKAKLNL